jgi:hypothetical protein
MTSYLDYSIKSKLIMNSDKLCYNSFRCVKKYLMDFVETHTRYKL